MFNRHDISRNAFSLQGKLAGNGYQRWWHSFTASNVQTGRRKSFFVEFYICNPQAGRPKAVFARQKGDLPSFLMVKAGCWGEDGAQLHKYWGCSRIELELGYPFSVSAGECFLTENGTHGSIRVGQDEAKDNKDLLSDSGEIAWSLIIKKKRSCRLSSRSLAMMKMAGGTVWHAEGMSCEMRGEVVWNGERYKVNPGGSNGYCDMIIGQGWASPHIRINGGQLSNVEDKLLKDSALCIFGGAGGRSAGKALVALVAEGREYLFDPFDPVGLCRCRMDCTERRFKVQWNIVMKTPRYTLTLNLCCNKRNMLRMRYSSLPSGSRSRLVSGSGAFGSVVLEQFGRKKLDLKLRNAYCELGVFDDKGKKVNLQNKPTKKPTL